MSSNLFVGTGLLTRFEQRTTNSGKTVSVFSLLISEPRKPDPSRARQDDGSFIDVESWNVSPQLAQFLAANVKQCRVTINARVKQDRWEDKQTGAKRSTLKFIANTVALAGMVKNGNGGGPAAAPAAAAVPAAQPQAVAAGGVPQQDEHGNEIPF